MMSGMRTTLTLDPDVAARLRQEIRRSGKGLKTVVVTEYGVAELRGRTIRQRALALIAIAAPAFRNDLRDAAHRLGYI